MSSSHSAKFEVWSTYSPEWGNPDSSESQVQNVTWDGENRNARSEVDVWDKLWDRKVNEKRRQSISHEKETFVVVVTY